MVLGNMARKLASGGGSTVVERLSRHPKAKGLSLATAPGKKI
jgi:hypothetical protein